MADVQKIKLKPRAKVFFSTLAPSPDLLFPVKYNTTCLRPSCKKFGYHEHCRGKTAKGQPCNNQPLLEQYCHLHTKQAKCFIPKCWQPAWNGHHHCWDHINDYAIYRALCDRLLHRGSAYEKRLDTNLLLKIISYL